MEWVGCDILCDFWGHRGNNGGRVRSSGQRRNRTSTPSTDFFSFLIGLFFLLACILGCACLASLLSNWASKRSACLLVFGLSVGDILGLACRFLYLPLSPVFLSSLSLLLPSFLLFLFFASIGGVDQGVSPFFLLSVKELSLSCLGAVSFSILYVWLGL